MRIASIAASLLLAVCISTPSLTSSFAAAGNSVSTAAPAPLKKKTAVEPLKPTWEQCYAMSRTRGFDHEHDEWLQSIEDCMAGKIPL